MNKFLLPIIGLTTILITACGKPSSDSADPNSILSSHKLTSFNVIGTSTDTSGGLAPIDPHTKSGKIIIDWTVRAALQNSIKLVVSNDDKLSNDDVEIYFNICNLVTLCGQKQVYLTCAFDTNNVMECGLLGSPTSTTLTSFLDTIPKDAFIIIQSCLNGFPFVCDTRSDGVQFQ